MSKSLIITIIVVALFGLILGVGGVVGFKMYTQLNAYKSYGTPSDLQALVEKNNAVKFALEKEQRKINALKNQFIIYRKQVIADEQTRAKRRIDTSIAAFTPLSGFYISAAVTTHEQHEACDDVKQLLAFERDNFDSGPANLEPVDKDICGTYIDTKVEPLFKYQMLRLRATLSSSQGYLKPEVEEKFTKAKNLLKRWEVPTDPSLEKYLKFE